MMKFLRIYFQIEQRVAKLKFSAETVRQIENVFLSEMNKGIHQQKSSLQMENTYVPELLNGTGCYPASLLIALRCERVACAR